MNLTKEERNAINALKRLSERWPKSLWLFSSHGSLYVMKYKERNEAAMVGMSYDPDYKVADLDIPYDSEDL